MKRWRDPVLGIAALGLLAVLTFSAARAQESPEASRPIRGTGEAGRPSSGVVTIQGILQGRPVTVDFHHTAVSTLHVLAQVAHISSVVHTTSGVSPHVTTFWVNCGTTAAVAVTPKADTLGRRRDLMVQNAGTVNIHLGGTHATVTATTGWTLHAASVSSFTARLVLEQFQGRLDCIADGPGQTLQIMEIWR